MKKNSLLFYVLRGQIKKSKRDKDCTPKSKGCVWNRKDKRCKTFTLSRNDINCPVRNKLRDGW